MLFQTPTPDWIQKQAPSETARYRHLTAKYCMDVEGNALAGVDIASQGDAVVPWAVSFDLPKDRFDAYCGGASPKGVIHLRGDAAALPFENESLDFVYSSHLLEDYLDWEPVVREWLRVLRPNGYLIILMPEKSLWGAAVANGQTENFSHKHLAEVGDLSKLAEKLALEIVEDRLTDQFEGDYSILGVFRKIAGGW